MLLAIAVVLALLVPSQQRASAKGVFFDPDSPAGKEYALPLDQAREEAAGGKSDGPAGKRAPLFGEGVSGRGSGPGASGGGAGGGPGTDRGVAPAGNGTRGRGQGSQQHSPAAVAAAVAISKAEDDYALSSAILWIAAIVALGGIAALALKAAQRPRPT